MNTFYEIIEETNKFSIDEQETFVEILQKRISAEKRIRIIDEARESRLEFESGDKQTTSIDDIMKEILT
ncbi:MAG: hypothetical protein NT007_12540 [Candidatus Kapabacteria bacterium]|nr:hypothetical protein [Candidatus Kapabacteria bacterium]